MDWANERYVRVYTRDTTTWKLLDWRGRTVLSLLIRKVDRAGVLDVGHDGVLGLAAVLELPIEIAEPGIAQLTASRGGMPTVLDAGTAYVLPNFIEAQEAAASDPQRKRESRARRREIAMAASRKLLPPGQDDRGGHETGRDRDENAEPVTPIRSEPSLADQIPDPPPAHAIQRGPVQAPVHAPAPDPKMDQIVHSTPGLVHLPTVLTPDEIAREGRRIVQLELRAELERERRTVAAELKVPDHGLLAQDPGERELAMHLVHAGPTGLAAARAQALHAIAMAGLEARRDRSLQWLTGAIFAERAFRRLVAMTAAEARRERTAPKSGQERGGGFKKPEPPPAPRPEFPPLVTVSEADRAEAAAMAAELRDRLFGSARAPPRSAGATTDETEDEQPDTEAEA